MSLTASTPIKFDLKWAQTLDGQLCDDSGSSQWITGPAELRRTHEMRRDYDGVLVGAGTFLKDLCQLTVRQAELAPGQLQPVRIIVDGNSHLATALDRQDENLREALQKGPRPTVVLTGKRPQQSPSNCYFIETALSFEDTKDLFRERLQSALGAAAKALGRPLQKIMVEGGPRLLTVFLEQGLYSDLFVSIAPILTGGRQHRLFLGRTLASKVGFQIRDAATLDADRMFTLREISS